jgi:serine/threonine protein kinase
VRKIAINLAKGIDTIHKKGIIHRDIKPQNILLTEEDEVKICDFSCAKFINIEKG